MVQVNSYSTHTDQRWYAGFIAAIGLGLGIAGGTGMWLWTHMLGPALLVAGVSLLMIPILALPLWRQPGIRLDFEGDELHICYADGREYEVYAVPASDFLFRQNFLEKKHNAGRIQVKKTIFYFYGVQNYAETRQYILENFPHF